MSAPIFALSPVPALPLAPSRVTLGSTRSAAPSRSGRRPPPTKASCRRRRPRPSSTPSTTSSAGRRRCRRGGPRPPRRFGRPAPAMPLSPAHSMHTALTVLSFRFCAGAPACAQPGGEDVGGHRHRRQEHGLRQPAQEVVTGAAVSGVACGAGGWLAVTGTKTPAPGLRLGLRGLVSASQCSPVADELSFSIV